MYNRPYICPPPHVIYNTYWRYPYQPLLYPSSKQNLTVQKGMSAPHIKSQSRVFPPVDPQLFMQSVNAFQTLLQDGQRILDHISHSPQYATELMDAAQRSDWDKINELIAMIDTQAEVEVTFIPEGITFILKETVAEIDCCILRMTIRWN